MHIIQTTSKKALCLLMAALMLFASLSAAFCAAAEDGDDPVQTAPLTVQVEMSKSAYFVTARAKAIVRVENTGTEKLDSVCVHFYSDKHRIVVPKKDRLPLLPYILPAWYSSVLIPELEPGSTAEIVFEMVLDDSTPELSFFERAQVILAQMIGSRFFSIGYIQMAPFTPNEDNAIINELSFRHGSANATLQIQTTYQIQARTTDPTS